MNKKTNYIFASTTENLMTIIGLVIVLLFIDLIVILIFWPLGLLLFPLIIYIASNYRLIKAECPVCKQELKLNENSKGVKCIKCKKRILIDKENQNFFYISD